MSDLNAVTYEGAIQTTQSDSTNDPAGPFAAIQNTGASGTCKILTVRGTTVTIYMLQGVIYPIATLRVFNTGGLSTVIGFHGNPYKGNAN